jgi:hypothetical protein
MIPLFDSADLIGWTATSLDSRKEIVDTVLALPTPTFFALETAARLHHMTVGQMASVLISRGLAAIDQRMDDLPTSSG